MKKSYLVVIAILAASVAGGAACGQEMNGSDEDRDKRSEHMRGPGRDFGGPEAMISRMTRHLGLDDTQTQSIENIMQAAKPELDALRQRSHANDKAVRSLDAGDAAYGSKLQNLSVESGELAAEMTLLRGRIRGDVHAVLTPEQQQKLAEAVSQMGDRRRPKSP